MSLDFAVLNKDGKPANSVALPFSLHHDLMATAKACSLAQLQRFDEYYDDVEVAPADLSALRLDVSTLQQNLPPGALRIFLTSLNELIVSAAEKQSAVHAISD